MNARQHSTIAEQDRGGDADHRRHPRLGVQATQHEPDPDREQQRLEPDRDRPERVQRAVAVTGRRRRERERRDHRRAERVQTQLLPHLLRAQQPELQQQHDDRRDRRRRPEHAQVQVAERRLKQEDHDRQHGEHEARHGELGDLVQPQLREARLDHDHRRADGQRLAEQQPDRRQHDPEVAAGGHSPGRHQHVHQDREQQQLLDARPPPQEREPRPGVLGDPSLLDLSELERSAVVLDRDPTGLDSAPT